MSKSKRVPAEISQESKDVLDCVETEITANKVLFPKSEADKAWNDAIDKCKRFIRAYKNGDGLFQWRDAVDGKENGND